MKRKPMENIPSELNELNDGENDRPTEFVDIEDDDDGIGIGITCKMLFTLAMFILQYDDDSHECSHLW